MLDMTRGVIDLRNTIADPNVPADYIMDLAAQNAHIYIFRAGPGFTVEGLQNIELLKSHFTDHLPLILMWADLNFTKIRELQDPDTRWKFDYDQSRPEEEMMRDTDGELALNWWDDREEARKYWLDPGRSCVRDWAKIIELYAMTYGEYFDGWVFDYSSETPWVLPDGRDTAYHHEPGKQAFQSWQAMAYQAAGNAFLGGNRKPMILANGRWVAEKDDLLPLLDGILFESFGTHWKAPDVGIEWMKSRLEFKPDLQIVMDRTVGPKAGDWDVWAVERTLAEYAPETYTACERR